MKLSRETNDAVRIVFELALNYEKENIYFEDIERSLDIPPKYIEYLLEILQTNKIIELYEKRKEKGIKLKYTPQEIKVAQVLNCFEEGAVVKGFYDNSRYSKEINSIINREIWEILGKKIEEIFGNLSFKDLIEKYRNTYSFMLYI